MGRSVGRSVAYRNININNKAQSKTEKIEIDIVDSQKTCIYMG